MPKSDPEAMTQLAWEQMDEIQQNGTLKLPKGKLLSFDPDQIIRVIQWLATQKARKPKVLDSPDDLELKTTRGSRA